MSDSLPKQKKLIPISEAAKVLGVSIDTVRRWDKSDVLHSERPDGKNRYFSLDELEKHKLSQPLPISEVAKKLSISPTTLRRLEARGLIKPQRNNAGERVYDEDLLENFLKSDYFLRKKQLDEDITELQEEKELIDNISLENEPEIPNIRLTPRPKRRINEFIAGSTTLFMVLITLSLRNIWISEFNSAKPLPAATSKVLSVTASIKPEISPEPTHEATQEAETKTTATIKINDRSDYVNIRQKPAINSEKIGKANDGDTFEFISLNSGWYEIRLADGQTGFISNKYIITNERNN